jgi:hypothetical protein
MTGDVARAIELHVEARVAGASLEERIALSRAAMTVVVVAMHGLDDSLAEMATTYEQIERTYLDALREFQGRAALLRDLVEFVTWEGYGLTTRVEDFLEGLAEEDADAALGSIAAVIRELKEARFEYPLETARRLRAAVLRAGVALLADRADG